MEYYHSQAFKIDKVVPEARYVFDLELEDVAPKKAWLNAGTTAAKYPHKTAWVEGFLKPLFGLVSFLHAVEKHNYGRFIK